MAKSDESAHIYTELDVLWDTRLGTLQRMDPVLAEAALLADYHKREADEFPGVDLEAYRAMYAARDVATLKNSYVSEAINLVRDMADSIAQQMITRPYYNRCNLVVNYHPYKLSTDELEMLWKAIRVRIRDVIPVVLVDMKIDTLTPAICKQDYGALIMYNPEEWLNTHMRALEVAPMPEIVMITPRLYHRKKPTPEELEAEIAFAAHPFQAYEWMLGPLVELRMYDVEHFSVVRSTSA